MENCFSSTDTGPHSRHSWNWQTIYFAMFFWTDEPLSRRAAERFAAGIEVYGVWDRLGAASVSSQDEMLCAAGARIAAR